MMYRLLVSVPNELHQDLRQRAFDEGKSISQLVREALGGPPKKISGERKNDSMKKFSGLKIIKEAREIKFDHPGLCKHGAAKGLCKHGC